MWQGRLSPHDVLEGLKRCDAPVTAAELAYKLGRNHGRSVYPQLKHLATQGLALELNGIGRAPRWLPADDLLPHVPDAYRVLIAWYRKVHPGTAELLDLDFEAFQHGIGPRALAGEE
jgi:hypothetical protein